MEIYEGPSTPLRTVPPHLRLLTKNPDGHREHHEETLFMTSSVSDTRY